MSQHNQTATSQSTLWSAPYYGVQHLGRAITDRRWATVTEYSPTFAELTKWRGSRLSDSENVNFDSAAEARAAGESWVERGV